MKQASIREFRSGLSDYSKQSDLVIITSHGKAVGCFLPLEKSHEVPVELKREFTLRLGKTIADSLAFRKVAEKEVLDDFKKFKKDRRRQ